MPTGWDTFVNEETEEPKVDYADVRDDFEFFLSHSTETTAQIAAMVPHLNRLSDHAGPARFLDFGCGTGDFTAELLSTLDTPPRNLDLFLVEPVREHRRRAETALSPFSSHVSESVPYLDDLTGRAFDLILANHSVYYLSRSEVPELVDRVADTGMLIIALQHSGNALARIWLKSCQLSGEAFPFLFADDVEEVFHAKSIPYDREMIAYRIEFPDTPENRYRVLHFLFGTYLDRIPRNRALTFFDPYMHAGSIRIDTEYPHMIVRA